MKCQAAMALGQVRCGVRCGSVACGDDECAQLQVVPIEQHCFDGTQRGVADRCQCEIRVVGQEINSNHPFHQRPDCRKSGVCGGGSLSSLAVVQSQTASGAPNAILSFRVQAVPEFTDDRLLSVTRQRFRYYVLLAVEQVPPRASYCLYQLLGRQLGPCWPWSNCKSSGEERMETIVRSLEADSSCDR